MASANFTHKIRRLISKIIRAKSGRSVSIINIFVSLLTKPIGYVRFLFIAAVFGASVEMDVFNVASGVIGLFIGVGAVALENAVLPLLAHLRLKEGEESTRNLMALAWWAMVGLIIVSCAAFIVAPGVIIKLFARGFDEERMRIGRAMIWWLMPYSVAVGLKAVLDTWAQHTERYTLSQISMSLTSPLGLIAVILLSKIIGPYAVAASLSACLTVGVLLMVFGLKDFPYKVKFFPKEHVKAMSRDFLLCLAMVGVGSIYAVTDTYFASMLATGSITSMTYAGTLFGILNGFINPLFIVFLAKSSKLAASALQAGGADDEHNLNNLNNFNTFNKSITDALSLIFAVFTPFGLILAATSRTWVELLLGYGAFSMEAVRLTGYCLAIYGLGFPFMLACTAFYRVAQARRRLVFVLKLSAATIVFNVFADWYFAGLWGAPGILFATFCAWVYSLFVYGHYLLPGWQYAVGLKNLFKQTLLALAWTVPLAVLEYGPAGAALGYKRPFVVAVLGVTLGLGHYFLAEKLGYLSKLPAGWKPSELVGLIISWARRAKKGVQG